MEKTLNDVYNDKASYVAKDKIWKDHVDKITTSARRWPNNWGFFDSKQANSNSSQVKVSSKSSADTQTHTSPHQIQASPRVPMTTSKMIGWRAGDRMYNLERYGSYSKGKQSITKSLQWPTEACE